MDYCTIKTHFHVYISQSWLSLSVLPWGSLHMHYHYIHHTFTAQNTQLTCWYLMEGENKVLVLNFLLLRVSPNFASRFIITIHAFQWRSVELQSVGIVGTFFTLSLVFGNILTLKLSFFKVSRIRQENRTRETSPRKQDCFFLLLRWGSNFWSVNKKNPGSVPGKSMFLVYPDLLDFILSIKAVGSGRYGIGMIVYLLRGSVSSE